NVPGASHALRPGERSDSHRLERATAQPAPRRAPGRRRQARGRDHLGRAAGAPGQLLSALALVALRDVRKRFGATEALRGASLSLEPGSVHALLGENGAGKTTLVRVLYGSVRPDAGEITVDGRVVVIDGPRHALALGIALVHQHSMLVPALTVAENLVLG